jgi:hypothetical protein
MYYKGFYIYNDFLGILIKDCKSGQFYRFHSIYQAKYFIDHIIF